MKQTNTITVELALFNILDALNVIKLTQNLVVYSNIRLIRYIHTKKMTELNADKKKKNSSISIKRHYIYT